MHLIRIAPFAFGCSTDDKKAFHVVDWSFLRLSLEVIGLGPFMLPVLLILL